MTAQEALSFLPPSIARDVEASAIEATLPAHEEILREGQFVKVVPIVLEGSIKVFKRYDDRELLLYYIRPGESCVMSFHSALNSSASNVYAATEETTHALLLPASEIAKWMQKSPELNVLFFKQYNQRYEELLETIHDILLNRMDKRLYDYLLEKTALLDQNPLRISHRQIANDLGTAREVISRVMKKLEIEGKVIQHSSSIELPKR